MPDYRFMLEIRDETGEARLGDPVPLDSPWIRAVEALRWNLYLIGRRLELAGIEQSVIWLNGGPHASHLVLRDRGGTEVHLDLRAFADQEARTAAARLMQSGLVKAEEGYDYRVAAYPVTNAAPPEFPLDDYPAVKLPAPLNAPIEHDGDYAEAGDFGVFVARGVIGTAISMAAKAEKKETGGVLLGRLLRPDQTAPPWLEISHLVPAIGSGEERKFTFAVETWNNARAVLAEREQRLRRGESLIAWFHSHPDFCKPACPPELRRNCALRKPFFSSEDQHLHGTLFPAAYSVGLLITDTGSGHVASMWGWRSGEVVRRAFHTFEYNES